MRIGFLLSGGGRTLENLAQFLHENPGLATISLVISDREGVFGLERARRLGITARVLPCRARERRADSEQIFRAFEEAGAELVLLGGFLRRLHVPAAWARRVVNIHPSLIPKYCGQGYHGDRVHEAVIAAGERESGCTVHYVDDEYDHGEIILQQVVKVEAGDTPHALAERVFAAECRAYPLALRLLVERSAAGHA